MQQRCFGCNKDNVPLFRERNKGRIFCGVSCQQIGASWWLDFKRLNKTKIRVLKGDDNREEEIEIEMAPRAIWNLIVESGMKEEQIVADFLNYDNYEDVFAEPVEKLGLRGPQIYRTNVERHNASLITMLTWLDENYRFRSGIDAWHFFHNMIIHMIAHPNLNDITAPIFNHLLTLKNYHPAFEELRQACLQRNAVVVARMLESGRFDRRYDYNSLIVEISKLGYAEIVELLLRDTRVIPLTFFHDAIKVASENGHAEVVALLLRDKRADPSASNNYAIRLASQNGHAEVVRMLMQDERVDPSVWNNVAIQKAAEQGHADVIRVLLRDDRVDPSADNNYAIQTASSNGDAEVVRVLLEDERVDPSAQDNYAIRFASSEGHTEVVALLLRDKLVLRAMTPEVFEKLRQENPAAMKDEIDAAQVSWARAVEQEHEQEEEEGGLKRVKLGKKLFMI